METAACNAESVIADISNEARAARAPSPPRHTRRAAGCGKRGRQLGSVPQVRALRVEVPSFRARSPPRRSFLSSHLPPTEATRAALSEARAPSAREAGRSAAVLCFASLPSPPLTPPPPQGLRALVTRVAERAEPALVAFEAAAAAVFARPAALAPLAGATHPSVASGSASPEQEASLDAQLHDARCRLAAVRALHAFPSFFSPSSSLSRRFPAQARASTAAMRAERASLAAQLAEGARVEAASRGGGSGPSSEPTPAQLAAAREAASSLHVTGGLTSLVERAEAALRQGGAAAALAATSAAQPRHNDGGGGGGGAIDAHAAIAAGLSPFLRRLAVPPPAQAAAAMDAFTHRLCG